MNPWALMQLQQYQKGTKSCVCKGWSLALQSHCVLYLVCFTVDNYSTVLPHCPISITLKMWGIRRAHGSFLSFRTNHANANGKKKTVHWMITLHERTKALISILIYFQACAKDCWCVEFLKWGMTCFFFCMVMERRGAERLLIPSL